MLVLERIAPRFGSLPEMRTYRCLQCTCVVEQDVERRRSLMFDIQR